MSGITKHNSLMWTQLKTLLNIYIATEPALWYFTVYFAEVKNDILFYTLNLYMLHKYKQTCKLRKKLLEGLLFWKQFKSFNLTSVYVYLFDEINMNEYSYHLGIIMGNPSEIFDAVPNLLKYHFPHILIKLWLGVRSQAKPAHINYALSFP